MRSVARPGLLRVVLVEDQDDDAALIARAMGAAGLQAEFTRVQTRAEFIAALHTEPQLVISDHSLPQFSSTAALACVREHGLDIPFIVVSGTLDEESAVTLLRTGAHDFVTKQNLARLGPAIRRELHEAESRAERRRVEEALVTQREFLRLVIDANPGLIFTKDAGGRFTLANRAVAELYGTTPELLEGRTHQESDRGTGRGTGFLRGEQVVMATGQPRFEAAEAITDARTGAVRWFETRLTPMILPDGSSQVLGIGREITERRAAEEALRVSEEQFRQAQKMEAIGQLAAGIAHDFNNLLTAILGYSDLLADQVREMPDLAADLQEIRKAGWRASELTQQLLAFGRKQVLNPQVLDLAEVVADVAKMLRHVIGESIQLNTVTEASLPLIRADRGQLAQVILNLAINARDAMPGGGTLLIETARAVPPRELAECQECVSFSVIDTGCGMAPDVRGRIFEPFFTTKGPGKGTGLGLSMVHGVVAQTGGTIAVESEPGHGTRVVVYLPAVGKDAPAPTPAPDVTPDLLGTETILLVEDKAAIRELVHRVLSGYGYLVLQAADTSDAIRIAEEHPGPIHLLLSDIIMPWMNGPELGQRLVPLRPELRVLYMSGYGTSVATRFGTRSDAVSLLAKPFTPERLATKVRESLSRRVHAH